MRILILSLLLFNCAGTRFMGMPEEYIEEEQRPTERFIYIPKPAKPVTNLHYQCCVDLCKGLRPASVLKEIDTPYIICECRNGKQFRVTRLKGATPNTKG